MPKKILILHGWNAAAQEHWFWQAKIDWEKMDWQVEVPELPGQYFPKKEKWVKIIESFHPDDQWTLIGHSLGGVAILRYLEETKKPIKQTILVGTPYDAMKFGALANFFPKKINWQKIKTNCPRFDLVYQDEDMAVPIEHGKIYAEKLEAKIHIVPGFNHFHDMDLEFLRGLIK